MHYHETILVYNNKYKIYRMCHKTEKKIFIDNYALHLNYFQRKYYGCWAPIKAQFIFCMNWFNEFHYLKPWSLFILIKNQEKGKFYFKIKEEFVKMLAWKKKGTSLLKTGFLVTLNLKERQKIDDLKLFKNWSEFKIICEILKII